MKSFIPKLFGISSIIGAIVYAFLGIAWASTHGSTGINYQRIFLGLDNLTVSRLGLIDIVCFLIAIWGLHYVIKLDSRKTKVFFRITVACLGIQVIAQLLQYYVANPIKNVENPLVSLGFLLHWTSMLIFAFSIMALGIFTRTQSALTRILLFSIGLLTILKFIAQGFLLGLIHPESVREIVLAYINFPVSLCWFMLGVHLLSIQNKLQDDLSLIKHDA